MFSATKLSDKVNLHNNYVAFMKVFIVLTYGVPTTQFVVLTQLLGFRFSFNGYRRRENAVVDILERYTEDPLLVPH